MLPTCGFLLEVFEERLTGSELLTMLGHHRSFCCGCHEKLRRYERSLVFLEILNGTWRPGPLCAIWSEGSTKLL